MGSTKQHGCRANDKLGRNSDQALRNQPVGMHDVESLLGYQPKQGHQLANKKQGNEQEIELVVAEVGQYPSTVCKCFPPLEKIPETHYCHPAQSLTGFRPGGMGRQNPNVEVIPKPAAKFENKWWFVIA